LVQADKPASEVAHVFDPYPQLLKNVRFAGAPPLDDAKVKAAIVASEAALAKDGRLLIRKSGTEPLVRVMAEAGSDALVAASVDRVVEALIAAGGTLAGGTKASAAVAPSPDSAAAGDLPGYMRRRRVASPSVGQ
jgi:phosphoglucosamine mutase